MNLETLLEATRLESDRRQQAEPLAELRARVRDLPPGRGMVERVRRMGFGVIAEVKLKSPSMGVMDPGNAEAIEGIHRIYDGHPVVAGISVLTQEAHFGGSPERLRRIRGETAKPVLRKDFIFSEYEVYYSRCLGADAMLLMANVVPEARRFRELHDLALELGMDVLCEVHREEELGVLPPTARMVGVNSRDFSSSAKFGLAKVAKAFVNLDLTTDLRAFELLAKLPAGVVRVAESGMDADNIGGLVERYRFEAALVGTSLLRGGVEQVGEKLNRFLAAGAVAREGT